MFYSFLPLIILLAAWLATTVYLKWIQLPAEHFVQWLTSMPKDSIGQIFSTFTRVLRLNWYTVIMLLLLWYLLFIPNVGKDLTEDYISNLPDFQFQQKAFSFLSLSLTLFLLSVSIWILPFFLYGESRTKEILENRLRYYLGSKIVAFLAIIPYGTVGSAFLLALRNTLDERKQTIWVDLLLNLVFIGAFFFIQRLITLIANTTVRNSWFFKTIFSDNRYFNILVKVLLWHLLLIVLSASLVEIIHNENRCYWIVPAYLLLSSSIVFRLLFYTNESELTKDQLEQLVKDMLNDKSRQDSKGIYRLHFFLLLALILYYLFIPSLTGTNSLYVLLVVFGFIVIYLDYMRNLLRNTLSFGLRAFAFIAILAMLVTPFVNVRNQFSAPLVDRAFVASDSVTLEKALSDRLIQINAISDTGSIYIVCGMGGGSRAGYITARVLETLNKTDPNFFKRTLCYSTVSGSSPGVYHYLKELEQKQYNYEYLKHIYRQNYNSSGVFGLLFSDATEALLGKILTVPISWFRDSMPDNGYYDRNVRIRREYDMAMYEAGKDIIHDDYRTRTFGRDFSYKKLEPDAFENYFINRMGRTPVHLINTFEVSTGRRTVLSPFVVQDTAMFTNSILPLQDKTFANDILNKDLMYRDAVNLSELFPLLSGASQIGSMNKYQFVDGGYFENYGLATTLDVVEYLQRNKDTATIKKLKILLIKNSRQETNLPHSRTVQLFAPLAGAMSSPFTGHANHFMQIIKNKFGDKQFYAVVFNDSMYNVPLTRALTARHIKRMDEFIDTLYADREGKLREFLGVTH